MLFPVLWLRRRREGPGLPDSQCYKVLLSAVTPMFVGSGGFRCSCFVQARDLLHTLRVGTDLFCSGHVELSSQSQRMYLSMLLASRRGWSRMNNEPMHTTLSGGRSMCVCGLVDFVPSPERFILYIHLLS